MYTRRYGMCSKGNHSGVELIEFAHIVFPPPLLNSVLSSPGINLGIWSEVKYLKPGFTVN